jgi:hypothetical protein
MLGLGLQIFIVIKSDACHFPYPLL